MACALCLLVPDSHVAGRAAERVYSTAMPQLHIWAHPLPGSDGGTVSAGGVLLPNQDQDIYIASGTNEFPYVCALSSGVYTETGDGPPAGSLVRWRLQARLKSSDSAGAVVDLHWTRTADDRASVNADTIERRYELSLSERNRVVLDVVRPTEAASNGCEGVAIEAELTYRDQPDLEGSLLQYDIWLVDTDASGNQITDHLQPRGLQGREIEYAFRPQKFDVDGNRNSSGPVSSRLEGSVKGRVRPDGRIDLVVGVLRFVQSGRLANGDGGQKQETVADGETIEVATPRLSGSLPDVPRDSNLFRAGHTAIRVTVRRIS
jgi:hypothetical protein